LFIVRNKGSIRQIFNRIAEPMPLAACRDSFLVQDGVQSGCGRLGRVSLFRISFGPDLPKEIEAFPLAFSTGSMSGCQCSRFVKEKQLCVLTWRHDRAFSTLEVQKANNPSFALELASNLPAVIMQASAISHECPAG
jgi:hypothetical protein